MYKYILILTVLLISLNVSASDPDCTSGGCFPASETDVVNQSQDQLQSISNSNNVGLSHPIVNNAPMISAPMVSMSNEADSCASDYWFVMGGGSRAEMRGVDRKTFGNGSQAVGLNAGYVGVVDNKACFERQKLRLRNFKLTDTMSAFASTQLACMNYNATLTDMGIDAVKFMNLRETELKNTSDAAGIIERDSIKICKPIITAVNKSAYARKEANRQMNALMNPEPKYDTIIDKEADGWHEYRLHVGNFLMANGAGNVIEEDALGKTCEKCDPQTKDYWKMKRVLAGLKKAGYSVDGINSDVIRRVFQDKHGVNYISLSLKPYGVLYTHSMASKAQQELIYGHNVYGKVRGMFGAERWKKVERLVRVQ